MPSSASAATKPPAIARRPELPVESFVIDADARVVSTPAYMLGPGIKDVAAGIEQCVTEVLKLAQPAAAGA